MPNFELSCARSRPDDSFMTGVRPSFAVLVALTVLSFSLGARGRSSASGSSSRSTPTPRASRTTRQWQRSPTAISSSSGPVTLRTEPLQASSPAASRAPASALASEFQVNAYTTDNQSAPSVATDADGDFVVAWATPQDGSWAASSPLLERWRCPGQRVPGQHRADYRAQLRIGRLADGLRWLAGHDKDARSSASSPRRSRAGCALASEFQVNLSTQDDQLTASVAADADGDFVVAWQSKQDGSVSPSASSPAASRARAPRWPASSRSTPTPRTPSTVRRWCGGLVVAWQSFTQDGALAGVFARRFSSAGSRGRRVPGQRLHRGLPERPVGCREAATAISSSPGTAPSRTARLRRLRPPLLERRHSPGRRVPGQHLHHAASQTYPSLSLPTPTATSWSPGSATTRTAPTPASSPSASWPRARLDIDGNGVAEPAHRRAPAAALPVRLRGATLITGAGRRRRLHALRRARRSRPISPGSLSRLSPLAQEIRLGSEFQVNTYTSADQTLPAVAAERRRRLRRRLGRASARTARATASSPAASRAPARPWPASSRSTPTPPSGQSRPVGGGRRRRRLRRRLAERRPGRRRATASSPAASRARAPPWPASSRSTPTRAHSQYAPRRWRPTPTATSSSPGRASARTARATASSPAASRARALALAGEFQVNTYTAGLQTHPVGGGGRRRRLRRRLAELRRRTARRLRHLRPPLLERGRCPRRPSSRSTPTPRATRAARRWRRTPTATSSSPGRASARTARTTASSPSRFSSAGAALGHRVPGQHLHRRQPGPSVGGGGRRRRLRRRLAERRARTASATASSPAASRARAHPWPASSRSTPTPPQHQYCTHVGGRGRRRLRRRLAEHRPGRLRLRRLRPALRLTADARHRRRRRGPAAHRRAPGAALPVRLHRRRAHHRRGRPRRLHALRRARDRGLHRGARSLIQSAWQSTGEVDSRSARRTPASHPASRSSAGDRPRPSDRGRIGLDQHRVVEVGRVQVERAEQSRLEARAGEGDAPAEVSEARCARSAASSGRPSTDCERRLAR